MHFTSSIALMFQVWAMLAASGQAQELPENLDVPVGYSLYRCAHGVGQQIYEKSSDGEWIFKEPFAVLFEQTPTPLPPPKKKACYIGACGCPEGGYAETWCTDSNAFDGTSWCQASEANCAECQGPEYWCDTPGSGEDRDGEYPIGTSAALPSPVAPIGRHFAGPTWQWNDGKKIEAQRVMAQVTVDATSLDWLLVECKTGAGGTEYVRRTGTVGGLAPEVTIPEMVEVLVPYSAEYCFYSRDNTPTTCKETVIVTEQAESTLQCSQGTIKIRKSWYGVENENECTSQCANTKRITKELCNDKSTCTVAATNAAMQVDPSPGNPKTLRIDYCCK